VGITTGTITINDEIITVQTTDTLATLFTKVTTPIRTCPSPTIPRRTKSRLRRVQAARWICPV